MSDFDWEEFAGDRFTFDEFGDKAAGRVVKIEKVNGVHGSVPVLTLAIDKAGTTRELWAGPADLKSQLANQRPAPGDVVIVEYVGVKPTGQASPMKLFTVEVRRGEQAPPAEPPPVEYADGEEPF